MTIEITETMAKQIQEHADEWTNGDFNAGLRRLISDGWWHWYLVKRQLERDTAIAIAFREEEERKERNRQKRLAKQQSQLFTTKAA